ncbi:SPW repeat protein [Natronorubrum daqingense]|uniref:SPW repeat-containing protein n=1 Tax=Natronorubrum daqingense TaxID=588898 RepID=A0A1N7DX35_9EURY|nr:SPW repeat protein [Natronorubrum daqingense]APX96232.1 hypothetical protein BB347_06105 [Natronorubrum daqingense]SIR80419.1 SPW repeat-containing protein [Natronorubrum daqingense]
MSDTRETTSQSAIPVRTAGVAAGLGAWILWSGVVLTGMGTIIVLNFLAGAAIAAFAAYTAAWPDGGSLPPVVAPIFVALLGLVVLAAPFLFEGTTDRLLWSNVISGLLVALLAVGSVYGSWQLSHSSASET